ncbi:MAG: site-2 protease family protein [Verrucomicrobiota bacterium]|nr:site-2 protease family protein [Limisphaera sp.]MDW8380493.1 site-2 protease family protein [Verrucomicrobiota bacterium]
MRWSVRIARVAGIEVRLHITFLLFLAWIGLSYYYLGGPQAAWQGVLFMLALFGCVLLHEFGHAFAALAFGIRTPDITLLPIGGVARLQRIPEKPWQELVVAVAGPLVNVGIAAILIFALGQRMSVEHLERLNAPGTALLAKLATVNLMLVLFNMIPAFPMDGGRVLRAVLAMALPYGRATQIAATVGQGLAFVLGFIGLFTNPMLIFIAFFVFLGAQQEAAAAQIRDISSNLPVAEAMVTHLVTLPPHASLDDAVEALLRTAQHEFPVLDADGRLLGVLTRDDLIAALKQQGPGVPVTQVMRQDLPVVYAYAPFAEAFRRMQECGCPAVPVVDGSGRFVGLITPENVGELMLVHSLRPAGARPAWRKPSVLQV